MNSIIIGSEVAKTTSTISSVIPIASNVVSTTTKISKLGKVVIAGGAIGILIAGGIVTTKIIRSKKSAVEVEESAEKTAAERVDDMIEEQITKINANIAESEGDIEVVESRRLRSKPRSMPTSPLLILPSSMLTSRKSRIPTLTMLLQKRKLTLRTRNPMTLVRSLRRSFLAIVAIFLWLRSLSVVATSRSLPSTVTPGKPMVRVSTLVSLTSSVRTSRWSPSLLRSWKRVESMRTNLRTSAPSVQPAIPSKMQAG